MNDDAGFVLYRFGRPAAVIRGSVVFTRLDGGLIGGLSGFELLFLAREVARSRGVELLEVEAALAELRRDLVRRGLL
ncbi:hypothetical protein OG921_26430 [Aldersonia sp. NBC_00410]|uniref:hypothetical protein n=1 Tax=Aldersonia sp. NBC_00410 TaxID=2975954 RepID=UPI0022583DEC|nr:hypothetical protein [Aldersonia sp. NBC_00410]MCX5046717.1 hypothetical protein [Aldersonia sp. NBC_00410]